MTSILKVDQLQDSGGNSIITSDGAGNITPGSLNIANAQIASNAAIATTKLGTGAVLQVVSTIKTDTFSTNAGGSSPSTITGLTASITPSSTSSKILVIPNVSVGTADNNAIVITMFRDTTAIAIGDAASSRPRGSFVGTVMTTSGNWNMQSASFNFLDSPSTTSSTTYSLKIGGNGTQTIYVNRSGRDSNAANEDGRFTSTMTLMEIAG